ncbi:MAG: hypothetical protein JWP05_2274 [Microbacteriaceae bacterium]|nr:hypothetical protein [Microbacteriaceae bacterium]
MTIIGLAPSTSAQKMPGSSSAGDARDSGGSFGNALQDALGSLSSSTVLNNAGGRGHGDPSVKNSADGSPAAKDPATTAKNPAREDTVGKSTGKNPPAKGTNEKDSRDDSNGGDPAGTATATADSTAQVAAPAAAAAAAPIVPTLAAVLGVAAAQPTSLTATAASEVSAPAPLSSIAASVDPAGPSSGRAPEVDAATADPSADATALNSATAAANATLANGTAANATSASAASPSPASPSTAALSSTAASSNATVAAGATMEHGDAKRLTGPSVGVDSAPRAQAGATRGSSQPLSSAASTMPDQTQADATPANANPAASATPSAVTTAQAAGVAASGTVAPPPSRTTTSTTAAQAASAAAPDAAPTIGAASEIRPRTTEPVRDITAQTAQLQATPAAPVGSAAPLAASSASAPTAVAAPPAPAFSEQIARPIFALASAGNGEHTVTVSVTPDNLGPVIVRAQVSPNGIRVELFAPNDAGREALRSILPELRRDLAGSGLNSNLNLSSDGRPSGNGAGTATGNGNGTPGDPSGWTRGNASGNATGAGRTTTVAAEPAPATTVGTSHNASANTASAIDVMV